MLAGLTWPNTAIMYNKCMTIPWKDDYNLGIKEIDDQHKRFIGILNELYDAIKEMQMSEKVGAILESLDAYTNMHFATEEKYFETFHYLDAEHHKEEHKGFKAKLFELKNARFASESEMALAFTDALESWLIDHIATSDKKYVSLFHEHGL